jgi:nitroreductase
MDRNEAIAERRAVREYTSEALDEGTVRRLIDGAMFAPSAVNQQAWTFTVVRDRIVLDRISREAKVHMLETMPSSAQADHFHSVLRDPAFHIFYHAPVLIVISASAAGPLSIEDCALAAEDLMLAAYVAGLGSCWIGFAQTYLNTPGGKEALGIPGDWVPVAPIIVGHPKAGPAAVPRNVPKVRWLG